MSPARTSPPRFAPDVDMMLVVLLRARLPRDVLVQNVRPAKLLERVDQGKPVVAARAVSPGSFPQTRNVRRKWPRGISVDTWAKTRRRASNLDDLVLRVLVEAQEQATPAAGAHIALLDVDVPGAEVREPDQPAGLFRWQASYSLLLRPV